MRKGQFMLTLLFSAVLAFFLVGGTRDAGCSPVQASGTKQSRSSVRQTPQLVEQGRGLFQRQCAVCHGSEGKGDGPASYLLYPKPRDLTSGTFKVRSTPSGSPPTDEDLYRTITSGLIGTGMPGFSYLSEKDRKSLVSFVKAVAQITERPEVVPAGKKPALTPKVLAKGKEEFMEAKCWECHGKQGKGDGPSAPTLLDQWGYRALPVDFTLGVFKGGGRVEDLYLRFTTGMDGTPMPSYQDSFSEADRWALAYYVKFLSSKGIAKGSEAVSDDSAPGRLLSSKILSKFVASPLPRDPVSPEWKKAPAQSLPLTVLWQRKSRIREVSVQSLHNGKELGLLVSWADPFTARQLIQHEQFSDAVAVQFALSNPPPHLTMGEKGKPVNIWYWRADREVNLAKFQDLDRIYTGMRWDWYPFKDDPTFLTGLGAGNYLSRQDLRSPVEDLNAEGFGSLTTQRGEEQNVGGKGVWSQGRWHILLIRSLSSPGPYDVHLSPGSSVPVAFGVWDGIQRDRDGQKSVTIWHTLLLEPAR